MNIQNLLAKKLSNKYRSEFNRNQFLTAWQQLTDQQQNSISRMLARGNSKAAGKALVKMVGLYARERAVLEAQQILSDGSMSIDELEEVFR